MPGKETNPIQQRMELLSEQWQAAACTPGAKIVRIHAEENEKDMVETFYTYLLGVDTPNHDIPIIFESIYDNHEQYSRALLDELKSLINTWNNANKDAVAIQTEPIRWEPDFSLTKKNNPAYLFTENINRLAAYLSLGNTIFLVSILKVSFTEQRRFNQWLEYVLTADVHPNCKILLHDTTAHPFYENIAGRFPNQVVTLYPSLDMDNAMQQVAAMGNPNDPAVQYRQSFIKLMQAIEKRNEEQAQQHAATCIDIADSNMDKSPYWIGQVIAVYAALANDQVGYKNYSKAIGFANDGVIAAERSVQLIADEFIYRKFLAQAVMLRGSLQTVARKWQLAVADFTVAADHYAYTNDFILAMEAYRMTGYCNIKYGDDDAACRALAKAVEMSRRLPAHIIKFTTFAGVIELLLEVNNQQYISRTAVQAAAAAVYGTEWMQEILHWKHPTYEHVTDAAKTIVA